MSSEHCVWGDLFDDSEKSSLENGFFISGVISVAIGVWLNMCLLMTSLRQDRSYRNLANFTMTACVRRAVALIPSAKLIGILGGFQPYCNIFACLETFLAVFEIEWLTHVCIERYVVAKYVNMGWPINEKHYSLFRSLCVFFATLYSFLPLFGIGRYGLDFSCTFCTFDMILPDSWQRYIVITIFFLRSIKPSAVMITMLIWAYVLEDKMKATDENNIRRNFTRNTVTITLVNLLCWTPIALIRGCVVLSQFLYSDPLVMTTAFYIKWAMWIHWMAPALTAVSILLVDDKVQKKMLRTPRCKINKEHIDAPPKKKDT